MTQIAKTIKLTETIVGAAVFVYLLKLSSVLGFPFLIFKRFVLK